LQRGGHMTTVVLETFLNAMWIDSFKHIQMHVQEIGDIDSF